MLIATYFKRPNSPIELPNGDGTFKTYFFRPIDPSVDGSEHVADVIDKAHIARLLTITEGYYIANADGLLDAAAAAATIKPPTAPIPQPEPPAAPAAPSLLDQAIPAIAAELPNLSDGEIDALEAAEQAGKTRKGVLAVIAEERAHRAVSPVSGEPDPSQIAGSDADAANALLALSLKEFKAAIATAPREALVAALNFESGKGADERATYTKALRAAL